MVPYCPVEGAGILGSEFSSPGCVPVEAVKAVDGGRPGLGWQVAVNDPPGPFLLGASLLTGR